MSRRIFQNSMAVLVLTLGLLPGATAQSNEDLTAPSFHHVGLNVTDPDETVEFYSKVFGALGVEYAGKAKALFTERSFLMLQQVAQTPPSNLSSAIWHIGWAGVDGVNEYEYWKKQGVEFQTPPNPLGDEYWMYLYGPDAELIEIFTGERHHRFNHVHLLATDPNLTTDWYARYLGARPRREHVEPRVTGDAQFWSNSIRVDNVSIIVFGYPDPENPPFYMPEEATPGAFAPTSGRSIDHLAFSYRDIDPVFAHMKEQGAEIVKPIAPSDELGGGRSFFVMAPDGVLVEVVEAQPIPDSAWE